MPSFYYDLSGLSEEQIVHVIVRDYLEGYSTKQIAEAYRLTFVQVAEYRKKFMDSIPGGEINFASIKRAI